MYSDQDDHYYNLSANSNHLNARKNKTNLDYAATGRNHETRSYRDMFEPGTRVSDFDPTPVSETKKRFNMYKPVGGKGGARSVRQKIMGQSLDPEHKYPANGDKGRVYIKNSNADTRSVLEKQNKRLKEFNNRITRIKAGLGGH
jgi:hypothetical protein